MQAGLGASGGHLDHTQPTPGSLSGGFRAQPPHSGHLQKGRTHLGVWGLLSTRPGTGLGEPSKAPDEAVPMTRMTGHRDRWVAPLGFLPFASSCLGLGGQRPGRHAGGVEEAW